MKRLYMLQALLFMVCTAYAQRVELGAGGDRPIEVMASSEWHWVQGGDETAAAVNTINGQGLTMERLEASRFLAQATMGFEPEDIDQVMVTGIEGWIDQQFELPPTDFLQLLYDVDDEVQAWNLSLGADSSEFGGLPYYNILNYAWWEMVVKKPDLLRNKIAYALSQILVVSANSDLEGHGDALASYYDIFLKHASGNYRDILMEVSLHPAMGFYLSHLNNPKANPAENIHPDENYAREFLQLFTIGLYELNSDGSHRKDQNGRDIPTYDQTDVKEFAKIWTGLGPSDVRPNMYDVEADFGLDIYLADMTQPMMMYEDYHQSGEKHLLNGTVVPDGQSGMEDIADAVDNVFEHPNVGPFIALRLIQRLVKSNPTPAYVGRVAAAFNNNGNGVRGDMKAVIKSILLDQEARSCGAQLDPNHGRLREPLVRYTHYAKVLDMEQYYDRFWNNGYTFWESTGQSIFGSPSVFNFYAPDYRPNGAIAAAQQVAPEFQIHNSRTSVEFFNQVNRWTMYNQIMDSWEEEDPSPFLDKSALKRYARDPEVLINKLDLLLTHGQLSDATRQLIHEALLAQIYRDYREDRVELAIYLIMISPDYAILK
ncbi:MAG: DUF1800 domain-containing protein [Saprospiraceae bacterium]|nr:DUF1800 domain-containing protein [Saprospiraceae bacterium]